jgi:ketosteroid isomerase-like protein
MEANAADVVTRFWTLMATNDFESVRDVLASDFVLYWPQTREMILGPDRFVAMNREYPSSGSWSFEVERIVASRLEAVSDVIVSDTAQTYRAVSFFEVRNGRIAKVTEYWPQSYVPPSNRRHLVELY